MSRAGSNLLWIPLLGSVSLGWLTKRGAGDADGAHLHWDRRSRRWVPHEDARLSTSATDGHRGGGRLRGR